MYHCICVVDHSDYCDKPTLVMLPYTAGDRTLGAADMLSAVQSEGPFASGKVVQGCVQDPL